MLICCVVAILIINFWFWSPCFYLVIGTAGFKLQFSAFSFSSLNLAFGSKIWLESISMIVLWYVIKKVNNNHDIYYYWSRQIQIDDEWHVSPAKEHLKLWSEHSFCKPYQIRVSTRQEALPSDIPWKQCCVDSFGGTRDKTVTLNNYKSSRSYA